MTDREIRTLRNLGHDDAANEIESLRMRLDAALEVVCDLGGEVREPEIDAARVLRKDAERLNWIERQHLEELSLQLVVDAAHGGRYYVCGDSNKPGYGTTLRAAIDAAMAED